MSPQLKPGRLSIDAKLSMCAPYCRVFDSSGREVGGRCWAFDLETSRAFCFRSRAGNVVTDRDGLLRTEVLEGAAVALREDAPPFARQEFNALRFPSARRPLPPGRLPR